MAGVSLKCGDCGTLLKSVEEAQEHAELTKHTDFQESTEAVLNLVCVTCGKPCRSKTESDLHTKRTGHTEFSDKTSETTKPIALEVAKNPSSSDVDMVDASSSGEPEEMVVPDVDAKLLEELESMGFSKERSTRALHFSGNSSLEAAANWIVEHENDADIDQMPLTMSTSSSSTKPPELWELIMHHFDHSLSLVYPELNESCRFADMKGEALEKYGDDYMCSSVLKICTKLRSKDPELFSKTGSEDIAKLIVKNLPKSDMIPQVSIHNGCFLTFNLSWEWIAKRIKNMLNDGIKTWAPTIDVRRAVVHVPESAIGSNLHADAIRAIFIQQTLAFMFTYSGVAVFCYTAILLEEQSNKEVGKHFLIEQGVFKKRSGRMHEPPLFVAAKTEERVSRNEIAFRDLANLWVGIYKRKADFIVYVAPVRRGGYIERCLDAARDVQWLNDDGPSSACYCGYRTSSNEKEKLHCLIDEFRNYSKAASIVDLGKAVGYKTADVVFEFALRYAYLKNHRLAEFPLSIDELFDEKGNTFVYLLHTQALVLSILKNPRRGTFKLTKAFVAKERELGLHLIRFTDEVKESCLTMLPHILCEYLWDLCKKFTRCYSEVRPVETRLLLCRATSVVMGKCLDLLRINTTCPSGYLQQELSSSSLDPVNSFIPWSADVPDDARLKNLNPRIELFSIFVSISADFKEGHLCGGIALTDFNGLQNGWLKSDHKNSGRVTYFAHDWSNPLAIRNESYIYFGNPSSRYGVSLASTIEIHTDLIVTSEKNGARKDACFELSRGKKEFKKSAFWENEDKRTECGTMPFVSESGFIQIHYILLKDAVDAKMELSFESLYSKGLKVCGYISAYYGKGVLDERKDAEKEYYHALIFKTDGMLVFPGKKLDLRKSVLAVPANGDLILEASLKDSKSGETIVDNRDSRVTYSVVTNKGFRKWKIPVWVKGRGESLVGSFNLTLEWSKGSAIFN